MADIIQLLPDAIANQIAAGEVIQRPASVVKELMENAIDAGGTHIKLIVKDAGKTLLQVIDNGCGMSETDARLSFERHATSKIRKAQDLFAIRTMGFRGEALASIAAVAQVEMRTRKANSELGVKLNIEGSEIKSQEACQCAPGTSISVRNLFFNIPARRNFLKSNSVEMRHINDEFQRIALANPDLHFSLHHNNNEVYHLPPGNLRQRIVGLFGSNANKKLVPVKEETDILKLDGYVGKPEFAKRTRGEQFLFVNKRFIKSSYLSHAVMGAYEEMLTKDTYPLYIIFLDIDPEHIDINVHPTKQEIKFDDERLVYNYLKVAIRHALGQHSITPMLDFDQDVNFGSFTPGATPTQSDRPEGSNSQSKVGGSFQPKEKSPTEKLAASNLKHWEKLYDGLGKSTAPNEEPATVNSTPLTIESQWSEQGQGNESSEKPLKSSKQPFQIHNTYIVSHIKSGFLLIDQQAAHERILYERYLDSLSKQQAISQKELFPKTIQVAPADVPVLEEMIPMVNQLGFDIQDFGNNSFVIHGVPANLNPGKDEQKLIESLIEQYKRNVDMKLGLTENIARSLAKSASIKRGQRLTPTEMQELIDKLFACQVPYKSPSGRHCFLTYELDELEKRFKV
ncbi:MAG: DNA mismatch repair endonuclease MutL [Bacteroidota bacterium]